MEVSIAAFRRRYQYDKETNLIYKDEIHEVYKALDIESGMTVALKIYTLDENSGSDLIEKVLLIKKIQHPNVIHYSETYEINTKLTDIFGDPVVNNPIRYQIVALEFSERGTLASLIKLRKLSLQEVNELASDIIGGLACLHQNNIVQRHLNPNNIYLFNKDSGLQAKIADFAASTKITADNNLGTLPVNDVEYFAPEFFVTTDADVMTVASDIWSFGVILFVMITGEHPFGKISQGLTRDQIIQIFLTKDFNENLQKLPSPFNEIVSKCLVREPGSRPKTISVLKEYLIAPAPERGTGVQAPPEKISSSEIASEPASVAGTEIASEEKAERKKLQFSLEEKEIEKKQEKITYQEQEHKFTEITKNKYFFGAALCILGLALIGLLLFVFSSSHKNISPAKDASAHTSDTSIFEKAEPTGIPVQAANPEVDNTTTDNTDPEPPPRKEPMTKNERNNANMKSTDTRTLINDTMYCFVSILAYYKPDTLVPAKSSKKKPGFPLYHFWSNVVKINCTNQKNIASVKQRIDQYVIKEFKSTRDRFKSYRTVVVKLFPTEAGGYNEQLNDKKHNYQNIAGSYDYNIDEQDINKTIGVCKQ